ncbi:peptidase inhibitor family I36 protein [Actinomadura xylanilytica]|uniref:peptidase inhibitor family I36 protein n=1 Tax=Actinomadura xylanilytica TaxID=887459 RepID=UPI00255A960A|nr:peptidase inhibitor family I36 protein [Actinomadura xylanilytica]MDL4770915.1 peptidase inhibitor family I36 protein [Actinomadura xylanilytica]
MNRIRIGIAGLAAAGAAAVVLAPAAALADVGTSSAADCKLGDVCVWSGANATGTMCAWDGDDPDWQAGAVQCKPYGFKVKSLMNHGRVGSYDQVQFYKYANYSGRVLDPLPPTAKVYNVDLEFRSHHWVDM